MTFSACESYSDPWTAIEWAVTETKGLAFKLLFNTRTSPDMPDIARLASQDYGKMRLAEDV